jgi:PASTA domain/FG-GAP-like repeat
MSRHLAAAALSAAAALVVTGLAGSPASAADPPRATAPHLAVAGFGVDQGWRTDHHLRLLTDLNGDGRADIVGFADDGVYTGIARADGTFTGQTPSGVYNFGYLQGWRIGTHPRWVDDITGDGLPDVVGIGDAGVYTSVGRGDGTFEPIHFVLAAFGAAGRTATAKFFLTDTDSDHRADLVSVGDGRGVQVATGQPDGGFSQPRTVSTAYDFTRFDYNSLQVTDVTGDGRAEILAVQLGNPARVVSSVVRPDGTYTEPRSAGGLIFGDSPSLSRIVDVTGDGRADLVELDAGPTQPGVYVARSLGDGTFAGFVFAFDGFDPSHGWDPARNPVVLADHTADGRADLVGFSDGGVFSVLGRDDGTFFVPAVPSLPDFGFGDGWQTALHPRVLADITADGRADIVGFGDAGVYTAPATADGGFVSPVDPPVIVTVPDVRKKTSGQASSILTAAGLTVAVAHHSTKDCELDGLVGLEIPGPGNSVVSGTTVTITIEDLIPGTKCN